MYVVVFLYSPPTRADDDVIDAEGTKVFHSKSAAGLPHGNAPSLPDIDAVCRVKAGNPDGCKL